MTDKKRKAKKRKKEEKRKGAKRKGKERKGLDSNEKERKGKDRIGLKGSGIVSFKHLGDVSAEPPVVYLGSPGIKWFSGQNDCQKP
eukprot:scaffold206601_cov43-Prasinocladus_malaysianus.AAC.1